MPNTTPLQYDADGLPIVINTATDYTRTLIARATAMRERNPNWYSMTREQQRSELTQLTQPTQQETPMPTTPTPAETTKHEAMIMLHVRFDMATTDEWCANNTTERMGHAMLEHLRNNPMFQADFTQGNTTYDTKLSWSGISQYKTTIASDNRRRPNVWLTGRLESMSEAIANWSNSWRAIRSTNKLFETCQHLDTDGRNNGYIMLPMMPHATMRRVVDDARTNMEQSRNESFADAVREAAITVLDGLFEDGLPVTHVNSRPEPF